MKRTAHRTHPRPEGPLVEVARTIGSTLGTVAATVNRAKRLAAGTPVRRAKRVTTGTTVKVKRKPATARRRVRKAIKRR
jgi:hypothetical protein